jgi:hypothetical protein
LVESGEQWLGSPQAIDFAGHPVVRRMWLAQSGVAFQRVETSGEECGAQANGLARQQ